MAGDLKAPPTDRALREQLHRQVRDLAESGQLPARTIRLLHVQVPLLARTATRNILLGHVPVDDLDNRLTLALKHYAAYLARRQQHAVSPRMPSGLVRGASRAWVLKLPCCSVAPGIWPFCRSGC